MPSKIDVQENPLVLLLLKWILKIIGVCCAITTLPSHLYISLAQVRWLYVFFRRIFLQNVTNARVFACGSRTTYAATWPVRYWFLYASPLKKLFNSWFLVTTCPLVWIAQIFLGSKLLDTALLGADVALFPVTSNSPASTVSASWLFWFVSVGLIFGMMVVSFRRILDFFVPVQEAHYGAFITFKRTGNNCLPLPCAWFVAELMFSQFVIVALQKQKIPTQSQNGGVHSREISHWGSRFNRRLLRGSAWFAFVFVSTFWDCHRYQVRPFLWNWHRPDLFSEFPFYWWWRLGTWIIDHWKLLQPV